MVLKPIHECLQVNDQGSLILDKVVREGHVSLVFHEQGKGVIDSQENPTNPSI